MLSKRDRFSLQAVIKTLLKCDIFFPQAVIKTLLKCDRFFPQAVIKTLVKCERFRKYECLSGSCDNSLRLIHMALVSGFNSRKWNYENLHGPGPLPHGKKSSAVG